MFRTSIGACAVTATAVLLAGCSASTNGGTPTPAQSSSSAATTPAATVNPSQSAQPTSIDPCQVVTASEASSLSGANYSTGEEETTSGGGKECLYGSMTTNVFEVLVAVASDPATAQADWATEEAKAQSELNKGLPSGVNVTVNINDTNVSGADKAAVGTFSATISGTTIDGSAVYLLKGAVFVGFSDLKVGGTAPTVSAMEGEASTALGRV